jgi:hypothetical protein
MGFVTLKQLNAEGPPKPPRWLVDGWLRVGGTSLWSAKPKAGKSTLLNQLAAAVATGSNFLGRRVEQGLACITLLDRDTIDDTRIRLAKMLGGYDVAEEHIAFARGIERSKPENTHRHLKELVADMKPALLILDTLGGYLGMETMDKYGEMRARLYELSVLAEELGTHIAVSHHDRKREGANASDRTNGSSAIGGGIESLVSILRDARDTRTIECSQFRYGIGFPQTQLEFDPETQRSKPNGTKEERQERAAVVRAQDLRIDVSSVLHVSGPIEHGRLISELSGRAEAKAGMLKKLVDEGVLAVTGTGRKGSPRIYSLAAQELEAA